MSVLLVDDRDESAEEAQDVLEAWARDDRSVSPDYLVELRSHQDAVLGTDSSVKIRPLRD